MRKTTLLKKMLNDPEILIMPGVYDTLSAIMAERCGAKAIQVSGYGLAGSYQGVAFCNSKSGSGQSNGSHRAARRTYLSH